MSERQSLHPKYVVYSIFQIIKGFWPLLLLAFIRGKGSFEPSWMIYAGIGALMLFSAFFCYLSWKKFGFWLESDRIIIRKGVLFRDEKTIYFNRIHSVNVEQTLIHRLLRIAQVSIETPGGNKKADGVLSALSLPAATRIREILRAHANELQLKQAQPISPENMHEQLVQDQLQGLDSKQAFELDSTPIVNQPATKEGSFKLSTKQLLQAAATSSNFGLTAAFLGAVYSFANDLIEPLLPTSYFDQFIEDSVNSFSSAIVFLIVLAVVGFLIFAWLLSILLYIIKYSGFTVSREGEQVSVSYGLLEKKTYVFDPKKVQAVEIVESVLRQPFGFTEVKLQVVSSSKQELLLLHPFIKRSEVQQVLDSFVPQLKLPEPKQFTPAPKRSLIYFIRMPLLMALLPCVVLTAIFELHGLWSLLLLPIVLVWRYSCFRTAGVRLADGQLSLQNRLLSRSTYLIRRPQIVTLRMKRSNGQERKRIGSLFVHALGAPFAQKAAYMERESLDPVWQWYSRSSS